MKNYEYFICFRGDASLGGAVGQAIYNTLYGSWVRLYNGTNGNGWGNIAASADFRAIITLKPRVGITSGSGTGDDPYIINNTNVRN